MKAKCFVKTHEQRGWNDTDSPADSPDINRTNLFGLSFRIEVKPGIRSE